MLKRFAFIPLLKHVGFPAHLLTGDKHFKDKPYADLMD